MYRMVSSQIFCRVSGWVCIGLAVLCGSCRSYRTFQAEVLSPAQFTLDRGQIGFLNRQLRLAQDTSLILYNYPGITPNELCFLFYKGLNSAWVEGGQRDSIVAFIGSEPTYISGDSLPSPYTFPEIRKICRKLELDYLISLETYFYDINPRTEEIKSNYCIRLYAADAAEPLDLIFYRDDLTDYIVEDMDFAEYMKDNAWNKGVQYMERLIPHWTVVDRRIYNKEKVLRMGDVFFLENHPEQALKLWEAATKLSPKIAIKAYMNLAWWYESQGDFEISLSLLKEARQLAGGKKLMNADVQYLEEYLEIVEKRLKDVTLIEKQMH